MADLYQTPAPPGAGQITPLMPGLIVQDYPTGLEHVDATTTPLELWTGPEGFRCWANRDRNRTWECPDDGTPIRPMHVYWDAATYPGPTYSTHHLYRNNVAIEALRRYFSAEPWFNSTDYTDRLEHRWRYDQAKPATTATGGKRRSLFWPPAKWYMRRDIFGDGEAAAGWQWCGDWSADALRCRPCSWVWEHRTEDYLYRPALCTGQSGSPGSAMDHNRPDHTGKIKWAVFNTWSENDPAWTGSKDFANQDGRNWSDRHHYESSPFGYAAHLGHPIGYVALFKNTCVMHGVHYPAPQWYFPDGHGPHVSSVTLLHTEGDSTFFAINALVHARLAGFDQCDPATWAKFCNGTEGYNPEYLLGYHVAAALTQYYGGSKVWQLESKDPSFFLPWVSKGAWRCDQVWTQGEINPVGNEHRIDPATRDWYWPAFPTGSNYGRVPRCFKTYHGAQMLAMKYAADLWDYFRGTLGVDLFAANYRDGLEDWLADAATFVKKVTPHTIKYFEGNTIRAEPGCHDWTTSHHGNIGWTPAQGTPPNMVNFGLPSNVADDARADAAVGYHPNCDTIKAAGFLDCTGTVDGTWIPKETVWNRDGDSRQVISTAAVQLAGGVATVPVEAVKSGLVGNDYIGAPYTLAVPIAGIDDAAVVADDGEGGGLTGGQGPPKEDFAIGWYALDFMRVRYESDTVPGEWFWLSGGQLSWWNPTYQKWGGASIGGPATVLLGLPGFITVLEPGDPVAAAMLANTCFVEDDDNVIGSGKYGWPSVSTQWTQTGDSWEELCTWIDWRLRQLEEDRFASCSLVGTPAVEFQYARLNAHATGRGVPAVQFEREENEYRIDGAGRGAFLVANTYTLLQKLVECSGSGSLEVGQVTTRAPDVELQGRGEFSVLVTKIDGGVFDWFLDFRGRGSVTVSRAFVDVAHPPVDAAGAGTPAVGPVSFTEKAPVQATGVGTPAVAAPVFVNKAPIPFGGSGVLAVSLPGFTEKAPVQVQGSGFLTVEKFGPVEAAAAVWQVGFSARGTFTVERENVKIDERPVVFSGTGAVSVSLELLEKGTNPVGRGLVAVHSELVDFARSVPCTGRISATGELGELIPGPRADVDREGRTGDVIRRTSLEE